MQIDGQALIQEAKDAGFIYNIDAAFTVQGNYAQLERLAQRLVQRAAEQERKKHQADIEAWKAEAATAEKWRGMALAKDPMQAGKAVQGIQQEARELEREACAKVADGISDKYAHGHYGQEVDTADEIAAAIRARAT